VEIARVTPSLPQRGRQPKGESPLNPQERLDFSFSLPRSTALLHRESPDEAESAPGHIAIRYWYPLSVF